MRKVATILLLFVMFINQVGYYFLCNYQQYQVRQQMKRELLANLPEAQLDIVIVEDSEKPILWEEEGREFYLGDEMYDVVRQEKKNGKTYIYCINDKKEKQLLDHLVKVIKAGRDTRKRSGKNVVKYQVVDFEPPRIESFPHISFFQKPQYACFSAHLLTYDEEIKGPPPRIS
ncbi:MAG: hypothetical protein WCF67_09125 [Chitinophagaceae bacterium]